MAQQLKIAFIDQPQDRAVRKTVRLSAANLGLPAGAAHVVVHDISETGMLVLADPPLAIGDVLSFSFGTDRERCARVVRRDQRFAGCRFDSPVPKAWISAALLQSPFDRDEAEARSLGPKLRPEVGQRLPRSHSTALPLFGLACSAWLVVASLVAPTVMVLAN